MISHRIQALAETAEEMYEAADNSAGLHSLRILFCVRYIGVISDSQPHQSYSASLPGLFKLVWKKKSNNLNSSVSSDFLIGMQNLL